MDPAWLVAQAGALICGDNGSPRDLDHVLWGMRMTVVMQLAHYKLRAMDVWTVEPEAAPERRAVELFDTLSEYGHRFQA